MLFFSPTHPSVLGCYGLGKEPTHPIGLDLGGFVPSTALMAVAVRLCAAEGLIAAGIVGHRWDQGGGGDVDSHPSLTHRRQLPAMQWSGCSNRTNAQ